jgi:hypothetical protein
MMAHFLLNLIVILLAVRTKFRPPTGTLGISCRKQADRKLEIRLEIGALRPSSAFYSSSENPPRVHVCQSRF